MHFFNSGTRIQITLFVGSWDHSLRLKFCTVGDILAGRWIWPDLAVAAAILRYRDVFGLKRTG